MSKQTKILNHILKSLEPWRAKTSHKNQIFKRLSTSTTTPSFKTWDKPLKSSLIASHDWNPTKTKLSTKIPMQES